MDLLNSPLIFVAFGIFIGAYIASKPFRVKVHALIDKYILNKKPKDDDKK